MAITREEVTRARMLLLKRLDSQSGKADPLEDEMMVATTLEVVTKAPEITGIHVGAALVGMEVTPAMVEVILVMRELRQHQQDREVRRRRLLPEAQLRRLRPPPTRATRGEITVLQLQAVAAVDTTTRVTTSPVLHMVVVVLRLPHAAVVGAVAPTAGAPTAIRAATGDEHLRFLNVCPCGVRTDDRRSSTSTRHEGADCSHGIAGAYDGVVQCFAMPMGPVDVRMYGV